MMERCRNQIWQLNFIDKSSFLENFPKINIPTFFLQGKKKKKKKKEKRKKKNLSTFPALDTQNIQCVHKGSESYFRHVSLNTTTKDRLLSVFKVFL